MYHPALHVGLHSGRESTQAVSSAIPKLFAAPSAPTQLFDNEEPSLNEATPNELLLKLLRKRDISQE
ncbi:hypothetical protein EVAR_9126_1 [Eumeta japonica]|uniref:Uncharacterized protein n=1 Tax=Eumeta variegata TaxID=151549 RepID=A0A4C1TW57_EUMVA|nr:hypothetical protein EVAR_9126_1 [Eumeta japonica]